jgi:replicative DNA helicase
MAEGSTPSKRNSDSPQNTIAPSGGQEAASGQDSRGNSRTTNREREPRRQASVETAGSGRVPPQDIEAEMSLLGSMMLHRDVIGDVLMIISKNEAERFYRPDHRELFKVLVDMYDRNEAVDLVTVRNELSRRGKLEAIGGVDYIAELVESVPSYLHAVHYAEIVRDKAILRELIAAAHAINEDAYDHTEEAKNIVDRAEKLLFDVTNQRIAEHAEPIREYLDEIMRQIESRDGHYITGLPTGYLELDDMLSGLQPGELIIVAARPSMGKTAFGLNVAENVSAVNGRPAAFFSMEMSKQAVVQRLMCSRGRIDSHKLRRGMLGDAEFQQLTAVCGELHECPLYIDDTPGMSVLELRSKARRLKMRHDIAAVFVDYLQLMHSPGAESRQQEVSTISRGLKALGRELNIPIVVMAQLNRNPEGRTGNRPRMSDLRESGAIEQDADVIMLLHREEYYHKDNVTDDIRGIAEVIVDKQRNGPTGIVKLHYNQKYTRFDNRTDISAEAGYADDHGFEPSIPSPRNDFAGGGAVGFERPGPSFGEDPNGPAPF